MLVLHKHTSVVDIAMFAHARTQLIHYNNILSKRIEWKCICSHDDSVCSHYCFVSYSIHSNVKIQGFLLEYCTAARTSISAVISFNAVADAYFAAKKSCIFYKASLHHLQVTETSNLILKWSEWFFWWLLKEDLSGKIIYCSLQKGPFRQCSLHKKWVCADIKWLMYQITRQLQNALWRRWKIQQD